MRPQAPLVVATPALLLTPALVPALRRQRRRREWHSTLDWDCVPPAESRQADLLLTCSRLATGNRACTVQRGVADLCGVLQAGARQA